MKNLLNSIITEIKQQTMIFEKDIIGVFLYGSQNYNLNNTDSDFDFICLVTDNNESRQVIHLGNGQIKIYTMTYFITQLRRGDLECYEILFTNYNYINEHYKEIFLAFVEEFIKVMDYDRLKKSLVSKLKEHLDYLFWVNPRKERGFYSRKRLYWTLRVKNQLTRLISGETFQSSLAYQADLLEDLLKIKSTDNSLTEEELSTLIAELTDFIKSLPIYTNQTQSAECQCFSKFYNKIESKRYCINDSI